MGAAVRVEITISREAAQALWPAMHDDDDLAAGFVDLAIHAALRDAMCDHVLEHLSVERQGRHLVAMRRLHAALIESVDKHCRRWLSYSEPPF